MEIWSLTEMYHQSICTVTRVTQRPKG